MRYRRPLARVTGLTADNPWDEVPELVSGDNLSFIAARKTFAWSSVLDMLFCLLVFLFVVNNL
jgi:hypothetical protein